MSIVDTAEPVTLIVDKDSERVVERCGGPEPDGSCPYVAPGDVLPCAGMQLFVLVGEDIEGDCIEVAHTAVSCPLSEPGRLALPC